MEQDNAGPPITSISGSRRTRSQVAPEWSVQDALILVNEISAVEGDCAKALSSYQKWTIVAENCTALEVVRSAYQCRRKWDSLLAEYKVIKEWELRSRGTSFWSLEHERIQNLGLPVDFNEELYRAIDELMKVQEEQSDTEPDSDPEAEIDLIHERRNGSRKLKRGPDPQKRTSGGLMGAFVDKVFKNDPGLEMETEMLHEKGAASKKTPHQSNPQKRNIKDKEHICMEREQKNAVTILDTKPNQEKKSGSKKLQSRSNPCKRSARKKEHILIEEELKNITPVSEAEADMLQEKRRALGSKTRGRQPDPHKGTAEEEQVVENKHENAFPSLGDKGNLLAAKVQENADLIHAVLSGKAVEDEESGLADLKTGEGLETERARKKADKLVAYLGDLAKHLEQLCNVVEEG